MSDHAVDRGGWEDRPPVLSEAEALHLTATALRLARIHGRGLAGEVQADLAQDALMDLIEDLTSEVRIDHPEAWLSVVIARKAGRVIGSTTRMRTLGIDPEIDAQSHHQGCTEPEARPDGWAMLEALLRDMDPPFSDEDVSCLLALAAGDTREGIAATSGISFRATCARMTGLLGRVRWVVERERYVDVTRAVTAPRPARTRSCTSPARAAS